MKEKLYETLSNWILDIVNKKRMATPEEIAVLPEIAKLCFDYELSLESIDSKPL